jgi:hypothetical protein
MTVTRSTFVALLVTGLMLSPAPLLAGNDKIPGGDPCGTGPGYGTGNPCHGNHGNQGDNGNSGNERTDYDNHPTPFTVTRPGNARGAFINQIGDQDVATIRQSETTQYARLDQTGDRNSAEVTQDGSGAHYALVRQTGSDNELDLAQGGSSVQVALLQQTGNGNAMTFDQLGGAVSSGLSAVQLGDDNTMSLAQSGTNNQARLVQDGSGNAMTASQTGGNNQLSWTQTGDNLSDLNISQTGGKALQVTQSR